jgi:hypothetical protein
LNFEKNWPYHQREMEKIEKSILPPEGNDNIEIYHENLKIPIFEI